MFHPAKQNRIFQDVVDQIQETILSGRLKPGDTLPAERELKEMLRVSRGTLREALRVLEHKGLISIKLGVGGGAVVQDLTFDQVGESLAMLIRFKKVSLNHLAEFRKGVEGDIAALAAQRATPEDLEHLHELLRQAEDHVRIGTAGSADFIRMDKAIHLALARITGNPVFVSLHHTVHDNIDQYYETYLSMNDRELKENFADLKDIVTAIEERRVDDARALARRHVLRFNHYHAAETSHHGRSTNTIGRRPPAEN
jgi:GntR family transcriptional regulator, transcriptional repressor for pyruvate dehydrogenase complex